MLFYFTDEETESRGGGGGWGVEKFLEVPDEQMVKQR